MHFLGHFFMVAIIVVSMVNPPRKQRKKEAATADKHDKTGQAVPPIQSGGPIHTAKGDQANGQISRACNIG